MRTFVFLGLAGLAACQLAACQQAETCAVPAKQESAWNGNMNGPGAPIVFQVHMTAELRACLRTAAYRLALTGEPVGAVSEAALGECHAELGTYAAAVRTRYFGLDYQTSFAEDTAVQRQAEIEGRRFAMEAALNGRLAGCDKGANQLAS